MVDLRATMCVGCRALGNDAHGEARTQKILLYVVFVTLILFPMQHADAAKPSSARLHAKAEPKANNKTKIFRGSDFGSTDMRFGDERDFLAGC